MEKREPHENSPAPHVQTTHVQTSQAPLSESERQALLDFWIYPEDEAERTQIDAAAQTPNPRGSVRCWRRCRRCSNPQCADEVTGQPYHFKGTDRERWNCPLCGKDRHCRNPVQLQAPKAQRVLYTRLENTGCRHHGGATPSGWDLPQTGTGRYSRVLNVDSIRADYERMLASPQLFALLEHIAWLQAHINTLLSRYKGGASRQLLNQMGRNRRETQAELSRETPDAKRLRQLQRELDQLIEQGLESYRVTDAINRSVNQLTRLIKAYDEHIIAQGLFLNADQVKMVRCHCEDTLHQGFAMWLDVSPQDADHLAEKLGLTFQGPLAAEQRFGFWQRLRAFRQEGHDRGKAFVSQRFKELAVSGEF